MKNKIMKNKKKLIAILIITLSLSGVVALADVVGDKQEVSSEEAQLLEAVVLTKKAKETSALETKDEPNTNNTEQEVQDIDFIVKDVKDTEETAYSNTLSDTDTEPVTENGPVDETEPVTKTESVQEEVDNKIVANKYKDWDFAKIGSLAIEDVQIATSTANSFVNIRALASEESDIVGKLYNNQAAAVLNIDKGWAQIESGNVKGYITKEYLNLDLTKDQAIENFASIKTTIKVNGLNVRQEADIDSEILTVIYENENPTVVEVLDEWVKILVSKNDITGYVSSQYIDMSVTFDEQAISIEEEREIIRKQKEKEEAERRAAEEKAAKEKAAKKKAAEEKAAKEAAAKKKAAEEKAAKEKTAKKTSKSSSKTQSSSKVVTKNHNPKEQAAKDEIARRESGGSGGYNAVSSNGRYIGKYQLRRDYLNGDHSPQNQERVVENYVANRYGSWQKALKFWDANGWY